MSTIEDALVEWLTQIWAAQERAAVPNCVYISGGYPAPSVPICVGRLRPAGVTGCGWYLEGVVGQKDQLPAWWPARIHAHNLTHITDEEKFVLARIEADRHILTLHRPQWNASPHIDNDFYGCLTCGEEDLCETVRLLAVPHATRAGYLDEWRP